MWVGKGLDGLWFGSGGVAGVRGYLKGRARVVGGEYGVGVVRMVRWCGEIGR